jgi:hypothetical protein
MLLVIEKFDYSNAPSLLPLLPFRESNTNMGISESLSSRWPSALLGPPTFMRYLISARNSILPRVFLVVRFVVNPNKITGFSNVERLANTISVTRLN